MEIHWSKRQRFRFASPGYRGIAHIRRNSSYDRKMLAVKSEKKKISNDLYILFLMFVRQIGIQANETVIFGFVFTPAVRMCVCVRGSYSTSLVTHR